MSDPSPTNQPPEFGRPAAPQVPQPPYAANPYAQGPYGQPAQNPYGQQPAPNPYGQPMANPYGQPMANPYAQAYQASPKSPMLGRIALAFVLVAGVIGSAISYVLGSGLGQLLAELGLDAATAAGADAVANNPAFLAFAENNAGLANGLATASFVGFVAWVTAIVASATRRGRTAGVWGIVLGVLAPIVMFIAAMAGMWPFIAGL